MDLKTIFAKERENKTTRFIYTPFDMAKALEFWAAALEEIVGRKPIINAQSLELYKNAIKYAHADQSGDWDINKGLYIFGNTGSGKTVLFKTLQRYMGEAVRIRYQGKVGKFNFKIFNARDIIADYTNAGFDGVFKYYNYFGVLIDDLGTETRDAKHYGTQLNCIEEIVEQRYAKELFTHYSSNMDIDGGDESVLGRYGDRVYSRLKQRSNIIKLEGLDLRNI